MTPNDIKFGRLAMVVLQNISKFKAPLNYENFLGFKTQNVINVQVSNKSVSGGFFFENK